jgi:hypothetical protein
MKNLANVFFSFPSMSISQVGELTYVCEPYVRIGSVRKSLQLESWEKCNLLTKEALNRPQLSTLVSSLGVFICISFYNIKSTNRSTSNPTQISPCRIKQQMKYRFFLLKGLGFIKLNFICTVSNMVSCLWL